MWMFIAKSLIKIIWIFKIWWHLSNLTLAPEIEASLGVFVYDKNATSNGGPKNALNTHWSLFSILEDVLFNTQV